jgi:hypothetical protein
LNYSPARKVLYSWTTPEQVAELRRDRQLLIRSEQAGMGRGFAFDVIEKMAAGGSELAKRLSTDLFPRIRYAWPSPWATRMGWPGEDYGNQLVRIVLKDSAWTAVLMGGGLSVIDSAGGPVPLDEALLTPERIGAIFFMKDEFVGDGPTGPSRTFGPISNGVRYREFIVGNEAMIEEWSLGTEQILEQLSADIVALSSFLRHLRNCGSSPSFLLQDRAASEWVGSFTGADTETLFYLRSLALPSEYYLPEVNPIAKIIDTLEADLFEPDPLLVVPGE